MHPPAKVQNATASCGDEKAQGSASQSAVEGVMRAAWALRSSFKNRYIEVQAERTRPSVLRRPILAQE